MVFSAKPTHYIKRFIEAKPIEASLEPWLNYNFITSEVASSNQSLIIIHMFNF